MRAATQSGVAIGTPKPERIDVEKRICFGVDVGVDSAPQAQGIAFDVPANRRVVIPEVVVVFRVAIPGTT